LVRVAEGTSVHFVFFYHSLISDWNHGNAHFLRGVAGELQRLGHTVKVLEPAGGWSLTNLRTEQGEAPIEEFRRMYPHLEGELYDPTEPDLGALLEGADVVLVHEWNHPSLVARIGELRKGAQFQLLFHDTHHRAVSAPEEIQSYDLSNYDGVLVFGEVLRRIYAERGWAERAWTWHEAADIRVFHPLDDVAVDKSWDLVWVGNWGDGERSRELREFLVEPIADLHWHARVYGVRYPPEALAQITRAQIEYRGWVANFRVPALFATARCTVHIPRRFYAERLPGIPTIRVFEALACGIPLVCAPWDDSESLFEAGRDYLVARNGEEMREHLRFLRAEPEFARTMAEHGVATIRARHTCAHRARELLSICTQE
jgi:spore maturation protein CgeB